MNNLGGVYTTGTITIAVGGVSVTGVGTLWTPIAEIGDWILCNGQVGLILTVNGDTLLTLQTPWQGTLPSGATYVLIKMSWLRYEPALMQAKLRELLAELEGAGNFIFTDVDPPDPAIGQDGDWALRTDVSPWQIWFKSGGAWVEQASPAGIEWRGVWSAAASYSPSDAVSRNGASYVSKTININQAPETNADDWDLMAAQGGIGPAGPVGLVWRGTWSAATAYVVNDGVALSGASYIAIAPNTNQTPPNATYWNLLAQGGSTIIAPDSVTPPMLDAGTAAKQEAFRLRLASAAFDALAYNGMQVNGSMDVAQEFGTTGTAVSGVVFMDGWVFVKVSTATVLAQQALVSAFSGFQNAIVLSVSVAGPASPVASDNIGVLQRIEGWRVARLAWGTANAQPITIGFWCKHIRIGTYSVSVRNASAADRSYVTTYTQNVSDVAEYKTVTIPGCTDGTWAKTNGIGLIINFTMAAGTTNTTAPNAWTTGNFVAATGQVNAVQSTSDGFRITGVVVLPGTQAPTAAQSPLIMRPYDQELVTCQRYYEKSYQYTHPPGTVHPAGSMDFYVTAGIGAYQMPGPKWVRKRVIPAVATYSSTTGASGVVAAVVAGVDKVATISSPGETGTNLVITLSAADLVRYHWVADARL